MVDAIYRHQNYRCGCYLRPGIANPDVLRRTWQVFHKSCGLAGGNTESVPGLLRIQAKQLRACDGRAEHPACRGDMPASRIMARRDTVAEPALDFGTKDERVKHFGPWQPTLFRQSKCRWCNGRRRMDDSPQVRVVIVEQIAGDRVDEGCAE